MVTVCAPNLGDEVVGLIADELHWVRLRPPYVKPYRTARGQVTRLFPATRDVAGIVTATGEVLVVRDMRAVKHRGE